MSINPSSFSHTNNLNTWALT